MNVVVSQPMFLPWIGLFEQIRLADVFVHYDDVQFPQGRSFIPRVQIKAPSGQAWLTAPVDRSTSGRLIGETEFVAEPQWRVRHLETLRHTYSRSSNFNLMFDLATAIYSYSGNNVADFNIHGIECIVRFFGLRAEFHRSSQLGIAGSSTRRLVDICAHFGASSYTTGLGALQYLDYTQFEEKGIEVLYMNYEKRAYPQLYGEFTPYVSILDAIANCGEGAAALLCSNAVYWKEFIRERE